MNAANWLTSRSWLSTSLVLASLTMLCICRREEMAENRPVFRRKRSKEQTIISLAKQKENYERLQSISINLRSKNMLDDWNQQLLNSSLVFKKFSDFAQPVSSLEANKTSKCSFIASDCSMEVPEQDLVRRFIIPADRVLELGARFGTTSCAIASALDNSGLQVSVEPDSSVWDILAANQRSHSCSFWTWRGVISSREAFITPASYATRAMNKVSFRSNNQMVVRAQNVSLEALQVAVNITFTVLLFDCEGCIDSVISTSLPVLTRQLSHVRAILIETDMRIGSPSCRQSCVDYAAWFRLFEQLGFQRIFIRNDPQFNDIDHVVYSRKLKS